MRNTLLSLLFTKALLLLSSCAEETITAFSRAESPQLTIGSISYNFSEIEVDRPVGRIPIPILGQFIRETANIFANIFVTINNNWDVDSEENFIEIPDIDYNIIQILRIKSIDLRIVPNSVKKPKILARVLNFILFRRANLKFIRKIKVFIQTDKMRDEDKKNMLEIGSFHYKREKLGCKKKCLNFQMKKDKDSQPINLVPYLKGQDKIYIITKLAIKNAPKLEFKIDGKISFEVGIQAPF